MHSFARAGLVALLIAAAGCGSRSPAPGTGEREGAPGSYFHVVVSRPFGGTIQSLGEDGQPDGKLRCGPRSAENTTANACGPERYDWNETVTLEATPEVDFEFLGWAADCSGTGLCTLDTRKTGADKAVAAGFGPTARYRGIYFSVSVERPVGGTIRASDGAISCGTAGGTENLCVPALYPWTGTVTLTATADAGYEFQGWTGDCAGATCVLETATDATDKAIGATFAGTRATSGDVGFNGGTVALAAGPTLEVGGGALLSDTTISVGLATESGPVPENVDRLGPIYDFGPDGLTFAEPITVAFPLPAGTTDATVLWSNAWGTGYDDLGGVVVGNTVEAQVTHFSQGFAALKRPPGTQRRFTVGGTVVGLAGAGLVLRNNGTDDLPLPADGPFTFTTPILSGTAYEVTVAQQPTNPSQTCTVLNGIGDGSGGNVTTVQVTCTTRLTQVGGTISGLAGSGLVIATAGAPDLAVPAGATVFAFVLPSGAAYAVTVLQQPTHPAQTCDVVGGVGTVGSGDVTSVDLVCTTNQYRIGGGIVGLSGSGLVLSAGGEPDLAAGAGATSFTFENPVPSGSSYAVTVAQQPMSPSQTCVVTNGAGTVGSGDVTGIVVTCSTNQYPIGGTISGLVGTGLVLSTAGEPNLPVGAWTTSFTFANPLPSGTPYAVRIEQQPASPSQTCAVTNGTGTVADAGVTGVAVSCTSLGTFTATGNMSVAREHHTATLLPNGKVLFAGGRDPSGTPVSSVELYDPATGAFASGGTMTTARSSHTATLLPDGRVLLVGGFRPAEALSSAEVYDPATGTFAPTGGMGQPRAVHTATLLPNGKVLVTGGSGVGILRTAELYDPATGTFTPTGSLATARQSHTATLLPNGSVLVTGGWEGTHGLADSERYDPATGAFSAGATMTSLRDLHAATLLPDGSVLVTGGESRPSVSAPGTTVASAEAYDPGARTIAAAANMPAPREAHTATLLPSGLVLLAGGAGTGGRLATADLYDPARATFVSAGSTRAAHLGHTATLLSDGTVLLAGGDTTSAERYVPGGNGAAAGTFRTTGAMGTYRNGHTSTLLPDGTVLVTGGVAGTTLVSAELYDPTTGAFTASGSMITGRGSHTATSLPTGTVLVAGGAAGATSLASAELYDPASGVFTPTGNMAQARHSHTATPLPNGKVLLAGGYNRELDHTVATAELYDPATGTFAPTGSMTITRQYHSATLLPDGRVLIAGGEHYGNAVGGAVLYSAELYDPSTGVFTATGGMTTWREGHGAALLPDGRVLVVGGSFSSRYVEAYDPATGRFAAAGDIPNAISGGLFAVRLPTGKVLVAGGMSNVDGRGVTLPDAHLYDAATGVAAPTGSMPAGRLFPTATVLPNGFVLVAGGNPSTAELYVP